MNHRVTLTCHQCGKEFSLMPCAAKVKLKNNKGGKVFCKPECYADYRRGKKL